ncbi:MAG: IreB family regulatory phosphoprotein [Eubacteriales bacterium]
MDRNTIVFSTDDKEHEQTTKDILKLVFLALEEKGYDPTNQMVGYILSGDPSYITSYGNARNLIKHIERDDLVEELLKSYLEI